jgi:hypothetical protein
MCYRGASRNDLAFDGSLHTFSHSQDPTRTFRFVFPNWRVGQNNYLFIGSEGAAKAAAIAYTLIETAKLNGVNPQAWLTDVLGRISDHKITRLDELMPWRYAQF